MSALPLEPFDDSTDRQPWPLPPAREDDAVRNQLALAAAKQALRRFTGDAVTGWGALLAIEDTAAGLITESGEIA